MPASKELGGCGLLTLKLRQTVFDGYTVLFFGQEMVIIGGTVSGIGSVASKMIQGFAFASLTRSDPADTKKRSDKTTETTNAVRFMPLLPHKHSNNTIVHQKKRIFIKKP
jgi:hypothetical protein